MHVEAAAARLARVAAAASSRTVQAEPCSVIPANIEKTRTEGAWKWRCCRAGDLTKLERAVGESVAEIHFGRSGVESRAASQSTRALFRRVNNLPHTGRVR